MELFLPFLALDLNSSTPPCLFSLYRSNRGLRELFDLTNCVVFARTIASSIRDSALLIK